MPPSHLTADPVPARDALADEVRRHQAMLSQQAQALIDSQHLAELHARRYSNLLAEVPVALLRVDTRGEIIDANRAAGPLMRCETATLLGQPLHRLGRDESTCQSLYRALHRAHDTERLALSQYWLKTSGDPVQVDLHICQIPTTSNQADGEWLVALVDQTPVYREHEALRIANDALCRANEANQELALVADRAHHAIVLTDAQSRIRWANPAFTHVTGYPLAEALGRRHADLLHGPGTDRDLVQQIATRMTQGEPVEHARILNYRKNGHPYWADLSILPLRDAQGIVTRFVAIEQDISDQLQAQSQREALDRAEASHAIKSEFLSRMSHNMRTPLNAVMGFSQLLARSDEATANESHRQKLDIIHQAGQQLLSLVDQALQLAQLEHHTEPFETQRVALRPVLTESVEMLRERALAQQMDVRVEVEDAAAWADPQRVREVVLNLLSNALKYSAPGSMVWLRAGLAAGPSTGPSTGRQQVYIDVQDQGVGIAPEALPLLFQPFSRLEATREMAAGHGLGLAISRRQAQLMQGDISVISQPGLGSTFRLVLPADLGLTTQTLQEPDPSQDSLPLLGALRIVYVEDNAMNRGLLESLLGMYPDVTLMMADSVSQGLALIMDTHPDVALLDINLPDGSGLDICRRVRAQLVMPQPVLIALSAEALPSSIAAAMEAGFNDYLVKPLQIHRLLDVLAKVPVQGNFAHPA